MRPQTQGFTRLDLLAIFGGLSLCMFVALPLLAVTRGDSKRAGCFNNLRQLGQAFQLWANDHEDALPWGVLVSQGGTRPDSGGKPANAWLEFLPLTNVLATPRVLACPADSATKVAQGWGSDSTGFLNSGLRANALSYFVSFDATTIGTSPLLPHAAFTGDRDFRVSSVAPVTCSRRVIGVRSVDRFDTTVVWTNAVHGGDGGHVLRFDGAVEFTPSSGLRDAIAGANSDDNGSAHIANAR
jgi:hypothetical protein